MNSLNKNIPLAREEIIIYFPRPGWHTFVAICAFIPITLTTIFGLMETSAPNYRSPIIISVIIISCLFIVLLMHFWKYEKSIHILQPDNILQVLKKNNLIVQYELNDTESIISIFTRLQGDFKYQLKLKKNDGSTINLLETENLYEGIFFRPKTWDNFAEKIAKSTNKIFIREVWREDFNGNLEPVQLTGASYSSKYRFFPFMPILVLFMGALAWRTIPVSKGLVLWGAVAVLTNMILSLFYVFKKRQEFGNLAKNNLILISLALSMTIPYIMTYLFFVFILNGFSFANLL